jgi:hypothetical protein
LDQATIEAMRAVVDLQNKSVELYEKQGIANVSTVVGDFSVAMFRLGVEALRKLVDEAAAGRGEGETMGDVDALQYLRGLRDEAIRASRSIGCKTLNVTVDTRRFDAAVQIIEAVLAAKSAEQPQPQSEPTLEECVAAMNRKKHRGHDNWEVFVFSETYRFPLDADEAMGLGRLLIAREKAADAKGGAK